MSPRPDRLHQVVPAMPVDHAASTRPASTRPGLPRSSLAGPAQPGHTNDHGRSGLAGGGCPMRVVGLAGLVGVPACDRGGTFLVAALDGIDEIRVLRPRLP